MPWIAYARRFDPAGPAARVGLLMINLGADEALTQPRHRRAAAARSASPSCPARPTCRTGCSSPATAATRCYLMLPVEDPSGPAERGIRPIEGGADPAENLQPPAHRDVARRGLCRLRRARPERGVALRPDRPAADEGAGRPRPRAGRDQPGRRVGDVPPHRRARHGLCAQLDRARLQARRPGQRRQQPRAAGRMGERAHQRKGGAARFRRAAARQRGDRRDRRLAPAARPPERACRWCRSSAISNAAKPAWRACASSRSSSGHEARRRVRNSTGPMSG